MKKIKYILLLLMILQTSAYSQTIYHNYIDGEIYFKIKNEIPYHFDKTKSVVNINSSLPFLIPFTEKYKVSKVRASFYFSDSETLQRTFRIYFSKKELVDQFIAELEKLEAVEYAERVPLHFSAFQPNDLEANSTIGQYGLYNIRAQEAWDIIRNNTTVKIAIVDNAVEISHSDLTNVVVASRDVSDEDNNPNPPNNGAGWDHGTHCAGIAGAQTDNGAGIASIAYGSRIIAVKATPDAGMANFTYDGYEGITWAATNGAHVISCSWGGTNSYSTTGLNVINAAYNLNTIIVACAQNFNQDSLVYPAAYPNVLSVGNTDINDEKSFTSNFGNWVDVSAPGEDIHSTIFGNAYGYKTGTSMSTPLVAGLCALIKSVNSGLTNTQIVNCVKNNADNIDALNPGFAGLLGTGRINAFRSVKCALTCIGNTNYGSALMGVAHPVSSGTIISANNIVVGGDVTFDAAVEVILQPNFIANAGSIFNARIDGCAVPPRLGDPEQDTQDDNLTGNNQFTVFPNPSSTSVNFKIGAELTDVQCNVYNMAMQLMKSYVFAGGIQNTIQVDNLPQGMYFIDAISNGHAYKSKFVVER